MTLRANVADLTLAPKFRPEAARLLLDRYYNAAATAMNIGKSRIEMYTKVNKTVLSLSMLFIKIEVIKTSNKTLVISCEPPGKCFSDT
ncbi:hypothetical protein AAFN90_18525 [Erwiniaceae bacterium CAU 1747]